MTASIFIGANSDIAQSTLKKMTEQTVFLLTREPSKITPISDKHTVIQCDPCDLDQVNQCFSSIAEENSIQAVVNFCGSILLKPAGMLNAKEWNNTIAINLNSAFNVAHATAKWIKKNCSVVFISTAAASLGLPNHEAIAAAKAGVEGLSRSFAASYAAQGIRSNVIAPGLIETKLSKSIVGSERGKNLSLSLHGLDRLGQPEDVAQLVEWLIQPSNNWVTGEVFRVDGGLSTVKSYPK